MVSSPGPDETIFQNLNGSARGGSWAPPGRSLNRSFDARARATTLDIGNGTAAQTTGSKPDATF
jgi:hypothetical protein